MGKKIFFCVLVLGAVSFRSEASDSSWEEAIQKVCHSFGVAVAKDKFEPPFEVDAHFTPKGETTGGVSFGDIGTCFFTITKTVPPGHPGGRGSQAHHGGRMQLYLSTLQAEAETHHDLKNIPMFMIIYNGSDYRFSPQSGDIPGDLTFLVAGRGLSITFYNKEPRLNIIRKGGLIKKELK